MNFENFELRLIKKTDLRNFFTLVQENRSRLERFFAGTVSRTSNIEETRLFLKDIEVGIENKIYFAYVIVDNDTASIIGFIDLKNIDWRVPKSEIGFFIDGQYSGKGIISKALDLLCEYCFAEYGFRKLFLRTHESNLPSRKVAEKCGFEIEGKLRRDYKSSAGELLDVLYYGRIQ